MTTLVMRMTMRITTEISLVLMMDICVLNSDPACEPPVVGKPVDEPLRPDGINLAEAESNLAEPRTSECNPRGARALRVLVGATLEWQSAPSMRSLTGAGRLRCHSGHLVLGGAVTDGLLLAGCLLWAVSVGCVW